MPSKDYGYYVSLVRSIKAPPFDPSLIAGAPAATAVSPMLSIVAGLLLVGLVGTWAVFVRSGNEAEKTGLKISSRSSIGIMGETSVQSASNSEGKGLSDHNSKRSLIIKAKSRESLFVESKQQIESIAKDIPVQPENEEPAVLPVTLRDSFHANATLEKSIFKSIQSTDSALPAPHILSFQLTGEGSLVALGSNTQKTGSAMSLGLYLPFWNGLSIGVNAGFTTVPVLASTQYLAFRDTSIEQNGQTYASHIGMLTDHLESRTAFTAMGSLNYFLGNRYEGFGGLVDVSAGMASLRPILQQSLGLQYSLSPSYYVGAMGTLEELLAGEGVAQTTTL
jgi:hypothetical protein